MYRKKSPPECSDCPRGLVPPLRRRCRWYPSVNYVTLAYVNEPTADAPSPRTTTSSTRSPMLGRPRRPPTKTSIPFQPTRVPPICDAPSRRRSITVRDPASNPWSAHSLPSCLVSRRSSTALSPHDWRSSHLPYLRDATAAWPYAKQCTAHLSGADSVPTPPTQRCVLSSTYRLYSPSKLIRQSFSECSRTPSIVHFGSDTNSSASFRDHDCFVRGPRIALNTNQPDPAYEVCRWLQAGRLQAPAQDTNVKLPSACQSPSRGCQGLGHSTACLTGGLEL